MSEAGDSGKNLAHAGIRQAHEELMIFRTWRDYRSSVEEKSGADLSNLVPFRPTVQIFDPVYIEAFVPDYSEPAYFYEISYGRKDPYIRYDSILDCPPDIEWYPRSIYRSFLAPNWALKLSLNDCLTQVKETNSRDRAEVLLRRASMLDPKNSEIRLQVSLACQFGESAPGVIERLYPGIKNHAYYAMRDALSHAEMAMELDDFENSESMFQYAFCSFLTQDFGTAREFSSRTSVIDEHHEGALWLSEFARQFPLDS